MKRHSLMLALIVFISFSFLTACASSEVMGRSYNTDMSCCKTGCAKMMEKDQCCCSGMRQGDTQAGGTTGAMCSSATMEPKKGAHPKNRGPAGVVSVK